MRTSSPETEAIQVISEPKAVVVPDSRPLNPQPLPDAAQDKIQPFAPRAVRCVGSFIAMLPFLVLIYAFCITPNIGLYFPLFLSFQAFAMGLWSLTEGKPARPAFQFFADVLKGRFRASENSPK